VENLRNGITIAPNSTKHFSLRKIIGDSMRFSLFPYQPRTHQNELMDIIWNALEEGKNAVVESGTGSGKTICAVVPTVEFIRSHNKRMLYLTRTNAQQRQAILECRRIGAFAVGIQGRKSMCPLVQEDAELSMGTPEELSIFCGDKKRKTYEEAKSRQLKKGCRYFYTNLLLSDERRKEILDWRRKTVPTVEEYLSFCRDEKLCPYELTKEHIACAEVITAPYVYFFNEFIRASLLNWMNCNVEDIVLIVDEAHNLPNFARDIKSAELSLRTIKLAEAEAEKYGDPTLSDGISITHFCRILSSILLRMAEEYVVDEDGFVPPHGLEERLMSTLKCTSRKISALLNEMFTVGEVIKDDKRKRGKLARSYISSLSMFLEFWMNMEEEHYARLIYGGKNPFLQAYCLDPSLATKIVNDAHASVHLSGTLSPLDEYRDSVGLEDAVLHTFPSPFPKGNRAVFYLGDVTSRYEDISRDEKMLLRMEDYISTISETFQKNTIVFFPSFRLMRRFLDAMANEPKNLYIEERDMTQGELMIKLRDFREQRGALFFSVAGGRISEGLDFPGRELEIAIIAGIPYPKPSAKQRALQHYYELKFGKGWEYTVKAPTTRKIIQSIGRLIRSEEDKGAAVILDKRARHFVSYIPMRESQDIITDLKQFFEEG